jgi:hypothetical protein
MLCGLLKSIETLPLGLLPRRFVSWIGYNLTECPCSAVKKLLKFSNLWVQSPSANCSAIKRSLPVRTIMYLNKKKDSRVDACNVDWSCSSPNKHTLLQWIYKEIFQYVRKGGQVFGKLWHSKRQYSVTKKFKFLSVLNISVKLQLSWTIT